MASPNLNEVTDAIARLIERNVARLLGGALVQVSKLPPEKAEEAGDTRLNLYLYHVAHDADGGCDLPLGPGGRFPIATRPLPLKLFYVLTAHSVLDMVEDVAGQQMLMGWAMKSLHDFAVIDDALALDGTQIFPTIGDRTVEIILRPIGPEEAVSFWATDQVRTARLAAYYEVRTVLLPPEAPSSLPGVAADFALHVRPGGRPTLRATQSRIGFTMPAALGGATLSSPRSPAVVALKAGAPDADTQLTATGDALGDGSDAALVLRGETLAGLGLPGNAAVLDLAGNAGWAVVVTGNGLQLSLRESAQARTEGGFQAVALLPGIYTLALRRELVARTESGIERPVEVESNRAVFAVAPFVLTAALDAQDHVLITVEPAFDVEAAEAEPQVSIGGELYRRVPAFAGDATDVGAFVARNGNIYEAVPIFDPTILGRTYPVRVNVNGVDSQPFWMEVA